MDIFSCLKEKSESFSKGQKRIAAYILENREEASVSTAAKIAKTVGVSESTVVRFALELGYSGYPEMQKALQEHFFGRKCACEETDIFRKALIRDRASLQTLEEEVDISLLHAAVEATAAAGTVYIYGEGSAAALADFFRNALLELRPGVRLLKGLTTEELCLELLEAQDGDVFLLLSDNLKEKHPLLEVASHFGCLTVTLGCHGGDYTFFSPADKGRLLPVSLLALLHSFLEGLADQRKEAVAQRAVQISDILFRLEGEVHEL